MRDLTHSIQTGMTAYAEDPPVELRTHATHERDGYRVTAVSFGSHAGTHVDAPAHTEPEGATIETFPPDRFSFDARLVDCRPLDEHGQVGIDALPDVDCELLIVRTGWDRYWGTDRYWAHPSLTPAAATWCAERGYDLAFDTPSPDPHGSTELPAHHALLGSDRLLIENLTGLEGLPRRFRLVAFPLALADADGAPVRAVADV